MELSPSILIIENGTLDKLPPSYEDVKSRKQVTIVTKQKDYLFLSIFNTAFCCFGLGIASLILSLKAKEQFTDGKVRQANENARLSRKLNIYGIIIGTLITLIALGLSILQFIEYLSVDNMQHNMNRVNFP